MKRWIKWLLISGCGLIVIFIAVLFIAPKFIDIRKFKPRIEKVVSNATGRTFFLGDDIQLRLFPLTSIGVRNVVLENAPEFKEKHIVSIDSFEVRVKLVPLLLSRFKEIQVEKFILRGTRISLEKRKDGTTNWEGLFSPAEGETDSSQRDKKKSSESKVEESLPMDAVSVDEFTVADSSLIWIDHAKSERIEITKLNIQIRDFSLVRPVKIAFSADIDGNPLSISGKMGPLGKDFGMGLLPMEFSANVLNQLDVKVNGSVKDMVKNLFFDMSIQSSHFSPRKIMASAGRDFPIITADPKAFTRLDFLVKVKGDVNHIEISEGVVNLDDSKFEFSGNTQNLSKPEITFDLHLDQMDLDRYLTPRSEKKPDQKSAKTQTKKVPTAAKKVDYAPLRRLVLDGAARIGKLKVMDARMNDLDLKVTGRKGLFKLAPFSLSLYQGNLVVVGLCDVTQDIPDGSLNVQAREIQSNPLLNDFLKKDILEGLLNVDLTLQFKGDDADKIIKDLNGSGEVVVKDGFIKGIDLLSMVRNTDGAYGFSGERKGTPRTEFSEFQIPFNIINGVVHTENTRLISTLVRVHTAGKANLVNETVNLRVEPTFVTTSKTDADKMKRSEVVVPVLVTGNLFSPKFSPDLRGIAKEKLEEKVYNSKKFKKVFEKEELKPYEKDVKGILEGILNNPFSGKGE